MWIIYLFSLVYNFNIALGILMGVSGLFAFGFLFYGSMNYDFLSRQEKEETSLYDYVMKPARKFIIIFLICMGLATVIPDRKTLVAMYTIPSTIEYVKQVSTKCKGNKEIKKLPDNVLKFVNKWLEENTKDD